MKYEAQVVMLPTKDKTSINLHLDTLHTESIYRNNNIPFGTQLIPIPPTELSKPQHLYVTVSQEVEPIIKGDWAIVTNIAGTEFICKHHNESKWEILGKNNGFITAIAGNSRKIIATTDKKLTQMRGSSSCTTNEGIEKFKLLKGVNYIPQQFIKEYVDKGGIDKILVGYEQDCCFIYKHGGCCEDYNNRLNLNQDNTVIIHLLEEKVTEEHFRNFIRVNHLTAQWDKWIKENL